ncbi:hypothetical protein ACGVWS_14055 [Enterobacteriaceae bacterium LUAb1]
MSALVCLDDTATYGGKIVSASSALFINGNRASCPKHNTLES